MQRLRLSLGNKPSITENMIPILSRKYELVGNLSEDLDAELLDIGLPLCLSDYDILRLNPAYQDKAIFPSDDVVTLCHDKLLFREWFARHFDQDYLPSQSFSTPLVIAKPRKGEWGHNTFLVETSDLPTIESVKSDPAMYFEDYIPGQREFSMHMLFDEGEVIFSALTTYNHNAAAYVQGVKDQPVPTSIEECQEIPQIFLELLDKLDYSGTASIDYKLDEHGRIKIFELNPRVGGSLTYLAEAYVDAYVGQVLRRSQYLS